MGGRIVSTNNYREYADECMDWAKTAKSDNERMIFLQMAQTWLQAAALSEGKDPGPGPLLLSKNLGSDNEAASA